MRAGVKTLLKDIGSKDALPVLLLHGFLGDADDWEDIVRGLGDDLRCLCADLNVLARGGAEACTMGRASESLLSALDALGVRQCALVGYSMGGRLALYCAIRHPARFSRVVLESASPGLRTEEERAVRREHDEALAQRLDAAANAAPDERARLLRAFADWWYDQPLFASLAGAPERREALVCRRLGADPAALAALLRGMGSGTQPGLWEALPAYRTPTLLVVGELDRKFRILAEEMGEACPAMAVEAFAGCGHNVHWENPGGYTTAIKAFLAAR